MRRKLALVAIALGLAVPVLAQDLPMADVGQGAPRETLAYVVAKPSTLMALAGWDDGKFIWWQEEPVMPDMPEGMEPPKNPAKAAMDTFLPLIRDAKRVDIAMVDVATAGPRMYIDVTLAEGATVEFAPDWLREIAEQSEGEFTITPAKLHGIDAYKYTVGDSFFPLFAFTHAGHLYICISDTAADQLASGLTRGPIESSLADFSRFKEWYSSRRDSSIEVWFNAYEIRRWVERGEGVLPEDIRELIAELDKNLELRTWTQLTFGLDYNPEAQTAGIDLDIQARRNIPLFEKAGFKGASFAPLARWLPSGTVGLVGMQFGDINGLIERLGPDLDSFAKTMEDRERAKRDAWEREWGGPEDGFPPMPPQPEGGPDRQEGPEPKQPAGPFSAMLMQLDEQLAEIGVTSKELFATLTGSVIAGTVRPEGDGGYTFMQDGGQVVAIGIKDHDKLHQILVRGMAKLNEENEGEVTPMPIPGFTDGWLFTNSGVMVALSKDALVTVIYQGDDESAVALMRTLPGDSTTTGTGGADLRGPLGELARSTSTMILGVDIYDAMRGTELLQIEDSQALSVYARPFTGTPIDNFVSPGFGVGVSATMTEKSLSFSVRFNRVQVAKLYQMAGSLGGGWDNKHNYAESQLQQLFGEIHQKYTNQGKPVPADINQLVADGIHRAYFQNISDSRFENAEHVGWFVPPSELDAEWFAGDPAVAAIKANATKDFSSYTLVPNAAFSNFGAPVIVMYETEPNTHGGRVVLYSTGQVGWLHNNVWEQAMALTKEVKPIPAPSPWGDFPGMDDFPEEFPGEDGGEMPGEGGGEMPGGK